MFRMYDGDIKLLNGTKCMYINSLTYVRVKRSECDSFGTDSVSFGIVSKRKR